MTPIANGKGPTAPFDHQCTEMSTEDFKGVRQRTERSLTTPRAYGNGAKALERPRRPPGRTGMYRTHTNKTYVPQGAREWTEQTRRIPKTFRPYGLMHPNENRRPRESTGMDRNHSNEPDDPHRTRKWIKN